MHLWTLCHPQVRQMAAKGSEAQTGFISRIHVYKAVMLLSERKRAQLFHQMKKKERKKKKLSGIPSGRSDWGYVWRPVGVSDCKVDSIIYSAIVNIPPASRQGSF